MGEGLGLLSENPLKEKVLARIGRKGGSTKQKDCVLSKTLERGGREKLEEGRTGARVLSNNPETVHWEKNSRGRDKIKMSAQQYVRQFSRVR